ncbi:O-antigen ligase [Knoellia remsis]|uniref:O-antigen ligase n=1 Tax=Knoellia remsis TaxID=407159 RepID=A0A2T0V0J8_9MICO|nr:O-antigen ligase family protein [Knoellia remsis]PRY63676.1 O-antigen ligase [Knoellia remsis]
MSALVASPAARPASGPATSPAVAAATVPPMTRAELRTRRTQEQTRSPVLERMLAFSLVAVVVATPWFPSLLPVLMLGPCALVSLQAAATRRLRRPRVLAVLAVVPLTQLVSLPTAPDLPRAAVLAIISVLGWGCAAAMVQLTDPRRVKLVLTTLLVVLVAVQAQALASTGQLSSSAGGAVVSGRLQGVFAQPNELGAFVVLLLPVLVAAAVQPRLHAALRGLLALAVLVVLGGLVMSLSRGSWLGVIAGLLALALMLPAARRPLGLGAIASVLGLVAVIVAAPSGVIGIIGQRVGSILTPSASPSDERPFIWQLAYDVFRAHPVTGVGPGGLERAASASTSPVSVEPPLHAHNLPLTVLAETGIIGLVGLAVLAAAVLLALGRVLRSTDPASRMWSSVGPLAGVIGAGAHGVIDFPWRNPALTLTAWLLAGAVGASPLAAPRFTTLLRNIDFMTSSPASGRATTRATRTNGRGRVLPVVVALLGLSALAGALYVMPQNYKATATLGLRSTGDSRPPADELKLLAQQYAVALSADTVVDREQARLGIAGKPSVDASTDPDTATIRVVATASSRRDAAELANAISSRADENLSPDRGVSIVQLAPASAAHASDSPPKLLAFGVGSVVVLCLALGLWLLRRPA